MTVKLLTEHHLEFLSYKGGCTGLSESTFVKMPHCWISQSQLKYLLFSVPQPVAVHVWPVKSSFGSGNGIIYSAGSWRSVFIRATSCSQIWDELILCCKKAK